MKLTDYATERQAKIIKAYEEHGTYNGAARALGIHRSRVQEVVKIVSKRAAMSGYAPESDMVRTVPAPYIVKGVSTLYDREGNVYAQWVKSKLDNNQVFEAIREWVDTLVVDIKGQSPQIEQPEFTNSDLVCIYPIGDMHTGMHAWSDETGDDFDLKIAENLLVNAIDRLVDSAPDAETAIIPQLGDFFHANDDKAVTPGSGHSLDVDTRHMKVLQIGLRMMRYVTIAAKKKHKKVIVRNVKGNHDPEASIALSLALASYFDNNPDINVELTSNPFWYYEFGKCLIGVTHGDGIKSSNLPGIMATDVPEAWGRTKFRYWYTGHIHHERVTEYPGVVHETFRTLASRDAWHNKRGYRSGRDMRVIVLHKDFGEIERHRVDVSMLTDKKV